MTAARCSAASELASDEMTASASTNGHAFSRLVAEPNATIYDKTNNRTAKAKRITYSRDTDTADLLGDASELSTVYMKPYTNDNVVRMKARMKAAVNYKFANEIFYLSA